MATYGAGLASARDGAAPRPLAVLLPGLVVGGLVAVAAALGVFAPLDGRLYDAALGLVGGDGARSEVLLVSLPAGGPPPAGEELERVTGELARLGASRLVLTFPLPDRARRAAHPLPVVEGRPLLHGEGGVELGGEAGPLPWGVVGLAPSESGVQRRQASRFAVAGRELPAIETVAAGDAEPPGESYLVAFRGGAGSLPAVGVERLLAGGLVASLVAGRTVLMGEGEADMRSGLTTPLGSRSRRMSLLEFHGQALDTLLGGRRISTPPPAVLAGLLLLLAVAGSLLYPVLPLRGATWLTAGTVAVWALLPLALLGLFDLWLPPTGLVVAQVLLFAALTVRRLDGALESSRELLMETSVRLRRRLWPSHFYLTDEPWAQVANMAYQTLDLERVIFLEKLADDQRLREVEGLHCSLDDIAERRRDIGRTPYTSAAEAEGPFRLERDFLRGGEADEEQYLIPLVFAGTLLGYWAFGVRRDTRRAHPGFEEIVERFTDEVAELLFHRQLVQRELGGARHGLARLFAADREREIYGSLAQAFHLTEKRLDRVEALMGAMSTAAACYNIFGQFLEASRGMLEILRDEGRSPFRSTALDLVAGLAGCELAGARRTLRHVILHHETVRLPVELASRPDASFELLIAPLHSGEEEEGGDEPAPFGLDGIVLELIDLTAHARWVDLRAGLSRRLGLSLRGHLDTLSLVPGLLTRPDLAEEERREVLAVHARKVSEIGEALERAEALLRVGVEEAERHAFPVDAVGPLERAVAELATDGGAEVALEIPELMDDVLAVPASLQACFRSCLAAVSVHATEGPVAVRVQEDEASTRFTFSARGSGLPRTVLRRALLGEGEPPGPELRDLRDGLVTIRSWGGELSIDGGIGEGVDIELRLRRFA